MKNTCLIEAHRFFQIAIILAAFLLFESCDSEKDLVQPTQAIKSPIPNPIPEKLPVPDGVELACENRAIIQARLVPIGTLSVARIGLVSATAGNKILFAGGMQTGEYSSRVDIYDIAANTWSTAELSAAERQGMAVATVGDKILFAGGGDNDNGFTTPRVDIFDASTNTWTTAQLSKAREYLAAATLGNKVFFAGGGDWQPHLIGSKVVDIYDNSTNSWSTAALSEGRMDLTASVVGNRIYFAGGTKGYYASLSISKTIDIYDGTTDSWTTSSLAEAKAHLASIAVEDKIYWAGGIKNVSFDNSNLVEIRDAKTGVSSYSCIIPKSMFHVVTKGSHIVFFTGGISDVDPQAGTHFDVYDTASDTWFTGVLNQRINDATVISVNDVIYVAGGRNSDWGPFSNQVWRLEY